jgi:hypothetical protein
MTGSGPLLKIHIKAVGKQYDISELKFTTFIFNSGSPPVITVNGFVQIDAFRCGDANQDSKINTSDAAAILRHMVGDTVLGSIAIRNGDVDKNGILTAYDASLILMYVLNILPPDISCLRCSFLSLFKTNTIKLVQPVFYLDKNLPTDSKYNFSIKVKGIEQSGNIYALSFDVQFAEGVLNSNDMSVLLASSNYLYASKFDNNRFKFAVINPYGINACDIEIQLSLKERLNMSDVTIENIVCNNQTIDNQNITGLKTSSKISYFNLIGAYPNPFNPQTKIIYQVPENSKVVIEIYDIQGRLIKSLLDARIETGQHEILWDGRDNSGKTVSTGQYYCRMKANAFSKVITLQYIR